MIRILTEPVTIVSLLLAACIPLPTDPEAESERPRFSVTLLDPEPGAVVPQNVTDLDCPANPDRGYGFRLSFDWADAGDGSGSQSYRIVAQRKGATYPIVDQVVPTSEHVRVFCNAFVIDQNLEGWQWKVRPLAQNGDVGPWTEPRDFSFAACRLPDGTHCHAPPAPTPQG